ncbi:hypothetical protein KCU78_g10290, partial [Aureobasidium melanogenum]
MEAAASNSVSVVALAALFNVTVNSYSYILLGRCYAKDFEISQTKLDLSRLQLSRWGEALGLSAPVTSATGSADHVIKAEKALASIIDLLDDAQILSQRFKDRENSDAAQTLDPNQSNLHRKIHRIITQRQPYVGFTKKAAWALYKNNDLENLIEDITDLINELVELFPATISHQQELAAAELRDLGDENLALVKMVADAQDPVLATVARNSMQTSGPASYQPTSNKLLAPASGDMTIRLWDATSGQVRSTLEGHTKCVKAVTFSPDGKLLASASGDKTVRLWDVASGQACSTLEGHTDCVKAVTFSHDGTLLASASSDAVRLWDVASGQALSTLEGHTGFVTTIAFSHDGTLLASASGDTVRLWDVASGQARSTLECHTGFDTTAALSHDGKLVASASDDSTVERVRIDSMEDLQQAIIHARELLAATPPDHPDLADRLHGLSDRFYEKYTLTASIDDLLNAISYGQEVLEAAPLDYPGQVVCLTNLGVFFGDKYALTGSIDDLDHAITYTQEALETMPLGDPNPYLARRLKDLSARFKVKYNLTCRIDDLRNAIKYAQEAVEAVPLDDPDRPFYMDGLAILFGDTYISTGSTDDLEHAVTIFRPRYSHTASIGDLELEWCGKALETAQENVAQIQSTRDSSIKGLLHNAIRLGRQDQVRCLIQIASSSIPVVHIGVDALYAAYFYGVLELLKSACTFASLSSPSHHTLQTIDERIGVCAILEVYDQHSTSWETAKDDKILELDLRAVDIPAGRHFILLYQWEYPSAIKNWRLSSPSPISEGHSKPESQSSSSTARMLNSVTVSGKGTCFEAMTCERYVRKRWDSIGMQVAIFLTEAAELVSAVDDDLKSQARVHTIELVIKLDHISDISVKVVAYAFSSHVCLFVQNVGEAQVQEIQDIAQWMCQTFRPLPNKSNDSGALQMSSFIQPEDLFSQAGLKAKVFRLLPLQRLEINRADCWTALFETGIVAETQCSGDLELEGIEMSFDLMTNLAAVETYHYLEYSDIAGGLILLGFFTALVPVRIHHSGVIQWHFEYSENDILRPMDLKSTQEPWAYVNSPSELFGRRCVIGIWPQANIMLGVQGTRLDLEDSGLPHRSSVLRPKGLELTAGLGSSGGPVQGILQGTRTYEHINTRQRFSRANAYAIALNRLSQAVSLIYDCTTHTGWLVPQMSLLLHLCHVYWARSSITCTQTDPIPWAQPSTDGASAALAAFKNSGDIVVGEPVHTTMTYAEFFQLRREILLGLLRRIDEGDRDDLDNIENEMTSHTRSASYPTYDLSCYTAVMSLCHANWLRAEGGRLLTAHAYVLQRAAAATLNPSAIQNIDEELRGLLLSRVNAKQEASAPSTGLLKVTPKFPGAKIPYPEFYTGPIGDMTEMRQVYRDLGYAHKINEFDTYPERVMDHAPLRKAWEERARKLIDEGRIGYLLVNMKTFSSEFSSYYNVKPGDTVSNVVVVEDSKGIP